MPQGEGERDGRVWGEWAGVKGEWVGVKGEWVGVKGEWAGVCVVA